MLRICCAKCKKQFEEGGQFCNTTLGYVHPECVPDVAATSLEVMRTAIAEGIAKEKAAYAPDPKDVRRRLLREKLHAACMMVQTYSDFVASGDQCDVRRMEEIDRMVQLRAELLALEDDHE